MANFQLMQLMQVAPSCGQFFNSCKWRHLVAKFGTNASGATISWRDNSSLDAIPWVRCASGNVYLLACKLVSFSACASWSLRACLHHKHAKTLLYILCICKNLVRPQQLYQTFFYITNMQIKVQVQQTKEESAIWHF